MRSLAADLNEVATDRMVKFDKFSDLKDNLNHARERPQHRDRERSGGPRSPEEDDRRIKDENTSCWPNWTS